MLWQSGQRYVSADDGAASSKAITVPAPPPATRRGGARSGGAGHRSPPKTASAPRRRQRCSSQIPENLTFGQDHTPDRTARLQSIIKVKTAHFTQAASRSNRFTRSGNLILLWPCVPWLERLLTLGPDRRADLCGGRTAFIWATWSVKRSVSQ